ncbi:GlxA family transcriptional regulator [Streptomyces alkaliterrae]|uniref:Helix-turn-helix domain-containing protein n=1 Tax=Streptomyces alkaliterrae TaxID=2213162 RepID=A0A5P0YMD5_9ACTN|nr:helix-turn-helix domain-containing protein [Streptomyces alkaliterrae]MBB1260431.1 helix-turn-helix domain-containing protein [Streptomyces alkaliterrae]MQS01456.1 helix-turn-helix domain-containing protein [Streptomyces alkaliterrae]
MTVIAILALDGVLPFELSVPGQVFGTANEVADTEHYRLRVCSPSRTVTTSPDRGAFRIQAPYRLDALAEADTVVVPAHADFLSPPPGPVVTALRAAAARGARMASVCVGAFTLAAAGLLDGHRVTTHWQYADELARRHPRVTVDGDVLFVDNGDLINSAGVAAALDLCLHLVQRDLGADCAAATARRTVMPLRRDGGQAQFVEHPHMPAGTTTLEPTLHWMAGNLHRPLTLEDIAQHAAMSVRSLNRHFRAQTGTTPQQWLLRARVRRAQQLLETTDLPIERVADASGFGSTVTLRHHFARMAGTSPHAYRTAFQARESAGAGPAGEYVKSS